MKIETWCKLWSRPDADERIKRSKSIHPFGRNARHKENNRRKVLAKRLAKR